MPSIRLNDIEGRGALFAEPFTQHGGCEVIALIDEGKDECTTEIHLDQSEAAKLIPILEEFIKS